MPDDTFADNRDWIRSEPRILRVNIQALLNGIEESVKNIRENHEELLKLAPEFFDSEYSRTVDQWLMDYHAEMQAMWVFHKNDPLVR